MALKDIMKPGKVALVTGAASGIGKAASLRFARAGMTVALVDLQGEMLQQAAQDVIAAHPGGAGSVETFPVDLSEKSAVVSLHAAVMSKLGRVDLLMNNAVTRTGRGHDAPLEQWRLAMEINFWAIVEAVRVFVPSMQATGSAGMIVNVGSKQGITNPPGNPIYNVTKSALKTYTESLEHELRSQPDQNITAHLLIPGWTTTGTNTHKPGAWLPDQVVEFMLDSLSRGEFYILCPDDEVSTEQDHRRIVWAAQDITQNRVPLSRWHPDFADAAKKFC